MLALLLYFSSPLPGIIATHTVLGTRPDLGPALIDAAKRPDGAADIQSLIDQGAPVDFQVTSGCREGGG